MRVIASILKWSAILTNSVILSDYNEKYKDQTYQIQKKKGFVTNVFVTQKYIIYYKDALLPVYGIDHFPRCHRTVPAGRPSDSPAGAEARTARPGISVA